jgi:hypothetical protein
MNDELKAKLAAIWSKKITSQAEFEAACEATRELPGYYDGNPSLHAIVCNTQWDAGNAYIGGAEFEAENWPIQRDLWREAVGLYPPASSVLIWMRNASGPAGAHFPHVSKDDLSKVAFTLDRQGALDDRKVLTSMGRLLRKFLIHFSDADIQKLEQMHQAEIDGVFEIAGTADEVERVYTEMRGDSGCMRYSRSNWRLLEDNDMHPSHLYAAPEMGLSVAYLQDADGNPTARSVVYTNPEDPTDKRYVRVYGDTSLAARLARAGYKKFGLKDARLPAIDLGQNRFLMAYMDPAGGYQDKSADRSRDASHVVRFKGEDFLRLVDAKRAGELNRVGAQIASITTQDGFVTLKAFDPAWMHYTCAATGERYDATVKPFVLFIVDGQPQKVSKQWLEDLEQSYIRLYYYDEGGESKSLYTLRDGFEKYTVPGHGYIFNNEATRKAYGLVQLSTLVYGEESPRYVAAGDTRTVQIDGQEHVVEESRVVTLFEWNAELGVTHKRYALDEEAKQLPKKEWVRLHRRAKDEPDSFARLDHPQLVKTVSGRSVLTSTYEVVRLTDGRWDFSKNAMPLRVGRPHVYVPKGGSVESVDPAVAQGWVESYAHYADEYGDAAGLTGFIMGYGTGYGPWFWRNDLLTGTAGTYDTRDERTKQMVAAADFIASQPMENVESHLTYNTARALIWGRVTKAVHTACVAFYAKREAERQASAAALVAHADEIIADSAASQLNEVMAVQEQVEEDLTF